MTRIVTYRFNLSKVILVYRSENVHNLSLVFLAIKKKTTDGIHFDMSINSAHQWDETVKFTFKVHN